MAYSRNFGFRSFENIVRDGRFRVPKTGTPWMIGTPVQVDPAAPGFLRRPAAAAAPTPLSGIVLFEHINKFGVDTDLVTTSDEPFNLVPLGNYAQMIHGIGTKVWFKNTTDKPLMDGRVQAGRTLVNTTGLAIGSYLTVADDDGAGAGTTGSTWTVGTAANGWLIVEQYNPSTGLVEARFTF